MNSDDFNEVPVWYCKRCLSLSIIGGGDEELIDDDESYCNDCGCTDIGYTTINEWETMYKERYGDNKRRRR